MKARILIATFCLLCFSTTFYCQSVINGSFIFQSLNRSYILYVPAIYNGSVPVPLVMNFHGYTSNCSQQLYYGDFRAIADTANFIIVCPNGTMDQTNNQYWNNYDVPGGPDDIAFTSALIDTISAHYNIDQHCIYSTGMSNGGIMSYDLAYKLSYRITAIASVAGSMIYSHMSACNPVHPTPVMEIHGTADGTVAYNGDMYFEPIDTLVKFWVDFNHCSPNPTMNSLPDINTSDGCTADHYVYSGGDSGTTVELYKIIGGGHSWPDAPVNINITNMDFNASVEIWRFFRQYKLNQLSDGVSQNDIATDFSIYPNPSNGNFYLKFPDENAKTITITNSLGQVVLSFSSNAGGENISIENAGVYFVRVMEGDQVYTGKVVRD